MGVSKNFVRSLSAFACVAGCMLSLSQPTCAAPNPNFHIYIAYGQSNMAGNGDIVPAEDQAQAPKNFLMIASHTANANQRSGQTNQSIQMGNWYPAIPPMFHAFENLSMLIPIAFRVSSALLTTASTGVID